MYPRTSTTSHIILAVFVVLIAIIQILSPGHSHILGEATRTSAIVTRVIDGDTIELESGQIVRYIGVDTPEITRSPECWALEAERFNTDLVLNKEVTLSKDVSETDRYGRLLRYVYVDDLFVNEELIKEGYAQVATFPPDIAYEQVLLQAEQKARKENKGLWGGCKN